MKMMAGNSAVGFVLQTDRSQVVTKTAGERPNGQSFTSTLRCLNRFFCKGDFNLHRTGNLPKK